MSEAQEAPHPFEDDDTVNHNIYTTARKIDKILHRETVADHAAILGVVQVTTQRRMHEVQERQQKVQATAQAEAQRLHKFGPQ